MIESDLPRFRTLNAFYAYNFLLLPDILLSRIQRRGPSGFFHSYARYRDYSRVLVLADSLDLVVRSADPRDALAAVFGKPYSKKIPWPPETAGDSADYGSGDDHVPSGRRQMRRPTRQGRLSENSLPDANASASSSDSIMSFALALASSAQCTISASVVIGCTGLPNSSEP